MARRKKRHRRHVRSASGTSIEIERIVDTGESVIATGAAIATQDHDDHGGTPHDDNAADLEARAGEAENIELAARLFREQQQVSTVSIDPAALAAEADAVAQDHVVTDTSPTSGAPAEPVGPTPEQLQKGYEVIALALVDRGFASGAPAWTVTPDQKKNLASAVATAVTLWFPGEIPPKYLALLVVAHAAYEIVDAQRDPATGKIKPARNAKPAEKEAAATH